jgi:hypothetical protein
MYAVQIDDRVAFPPDCSPSSSERLPNSGGQYTNTSKAAQEKRFEFCFSSPRKKREYSAARAAVHELFEQEIR